MAVMQDVDHRPDSRFWIVDERMFGASRAKREAAKEGDVFVGEWREATRAVAGGFQVNREVH
jgi:hypothetical protein